MPLIKINNDPCPTITPTANNGVQIKQVNNSKRTVKRNNNPAFTLAPLTSNSSTVQNATQFLPIAPKTLLDLTDVQVDVLANGSMMYYNSTTNTFIIDVLSDMSFDVDGGSF